ncbi:hypothetical protein K440DRAFT_589787 [Wilcoxina mikolae CBS 423.85]|nr:hypothetical protein K440DRAFT_589787 [Wilcoxina mikolae CBS 423.85]
MACTKSSHKAQPQRLRIAVRIFLFVFILACIAASLELALHKPSTLDIHALLRSWGLPASTYWNTIYPTSFMRDIRPLPIHSHNDYWRRVPFYSALAAGAISVEADVWEYGGELFVGHDTGSLTRNRTLKNLYVNPIMEVLDGMNRPDEIPIAGEGGLRGVFDEEPKQTLNLYIDIKTPGVSTLPVVIAHLEPLRKPRNFLTHWNGTDLVRGLVTVHLTGNTPFEEMVKKEYRDYFYDAPLRELKSGRYNTSNSLMATADFGKEVGSVYWGMGGMNEQMKNTVREHIKEAHQRGIGVRYWSTPVWPVSVRNEVWGQLVKLGVDLLGVDDLKSATERSW